MDLRHGVPNPIWSVGFDELRPSANWLNLAGQRKKPGYPVNGIGEEETHNFRRGEPLQQPERLEKINSKSQK
jgi:hypothetical protein